MSAGFLLRRWQMASAYVPAMGLFVHGAPATWLLLGLIALLALAFALLVQEKKPDAGPQDFLSAFTCPQAGQMTVWAAAGLLMMAAGALGLKDGIVSLQLWRAMPESHPLSAPAAQLLTGALCIPAGAAVLQMGKAAYRGTQDDAASLLASFPALAGVVWLFTSHLNNGTEPVLMKYGFRLAAICLLTLAHYYTAAFFFDRPRRRRTAFLSLFGAVLAILSLADRSECLLSVRKPTKPRTLDGGAFCPQFRRCGLVPVRSAPSHSVPHIMISKGDRYHGKKTFLYHHPHLLPQRQAAHRPYLLHRGHRRHGPL